jgi:hypothetical protein
MVALFSSEDVLLQQAPFSSFAGVNLLSYYGEKGYGKSPVPQDRAHSPRLKL